MKFFDRKSEIAELREVRRKSRKSARFTVVVGRRRVGKTVLMRKAFEDEPYLYFYVSRKSEIELCEEYAELLERTLGVKMHGRVQRFSEVFRTVLEESVRRPITLVIDEFQDFRRVDPAIFGEMARDWDEFHMKAKVNLVVCGSMNRMMSQIFTDEGEPLYGRNTGKMEIRPFSVATLKEILSAYSPKFAPDDLLGLWAFTGGVGRYVALLMDEGAVTPKRMMSVMIRDGSSFIDEGKVVLIQEFGKDYGVYFTILSSIARGKTTRSEIEAMIGGSASGYISKLEDAYGLIEKVQPLFETKSNKGCAYRIKDNFFRFWFRFVYKYNYLVELQLYDDLRKIVERDYTTFSGLALEGYFKTKFTEAKAYTRMGAWWDRRGENEIDLVCENEFKKRLEFFEVKRDGSRYDESGLIRKTEAFFEKNPDKRSLKMSYRGLSLKDM